MSSTKTFDDSMAVSEGFSRIDNHAGWRDGVVATPQGFVTVYSQWGANPHSRIDFIYKGRLLMRNRNRCYSPRGLAMLAKRFAKEVASR